MKTIAVIPARYAATRFHGKLMQTIGDKTIIRRVYENARDTGLFDQVLVVTDSDIIFDEIISAGGTVYKSKLEHQSGSDRIAEAIEMMDVDVVVNIQGDEPFIVKEPLENLIRCFQEPGVQVASLMKKFSDEEDPQNPNLVKVVRDNNNNALYFSRSPIPFFRNTSSDVVYYKHIGVYAYRKEMLLAFRSWPASSLEKTEMLEQLRYLEHGVSIRMVETETSSIGIDTPEDLEHARAYFQSMQG